MPNFRPKNRSYQTRLAGQLSSASRPVKFENLTEVNGTKIIMTDHAKKQCQNRHGLPLDSCRQWFIDMQHVWGSVPVVEYNQEVFVYSYKYQRGMVLAYRRDFKNPSRSDLAVVVVTVYPYGKAVPMKADTMVYRG